MTNDRKRRLRTILQALAAALTVAAGVQLGPLVDGLKAVGFDVTDLSGVDPATLGALATITGVLAGAFTKLHQALDKSRLRSPLQIAPVDETDTDTDDGHGAPAEA